MKVAAPIWAEKPPGVSQKQWEVTELVFALENDTLIDSGASHSYVPSRVPLTNVTELAGETVTTATGQVEQIREMGDMGPLKGVRRAPSFKRALISVFDLANQFGKVEFVDRKCFLVSHGLRTCIGDANEAHLYIFDLLALDDHVRRVEGRPTIVQKHTTTYKGRGGPRKSDYDIMSDGSKSRPWKQGPPVDNSWQSYEDGLIPGDDGKFYGDSAVGAAAIGQAAPVGARGLAD